MLGTFFATGGYTTGKSLSVFYLSRSLIIEFLYAIIQTKKIIKFQKYNKNMNYKPYLARKIHTTKDGKYFIWLGDHKIWITSIFGLDSISVKKSDITEDYLLEFPLPGVEYVTRESYFGAGLVEEFVSTPGVSTSVLLGTPGRKGNVAFDIVEGGDNFISGFPFTFTKHTGERRECYLVSYKGTITYKLTPSGVLAPDPLTIRLNELGQPEVVSVG